MISIAIIKSPRTSNRLCTWTGTTCTSIYPWRCRGHNEHIYVSGCSQSKNSITLDCNYLLTVKHTRRAAAGAGRLKALMPPAVHVLHVPGSQRIGCFEISCKSRNSTSRDQSFAISGTSAWVFSSSHGLIINTRHRTLIIPNFTCFSLRNTRGSNSRNIDDTYSAMLS